MLEAFTHLADWLTYNVLGLAAYLGVLCAISPCPLATNIAAVGFVSRGLSPVRTLLADCFTPPGAPPSMC